MLASAFSPNICLTMSGGEECRGSSLANVFMTIITIIFIVIIIIIYLSVWIFSDRPIQCSLYSTVFENWKLHSSFCWRSELIWKSELIFVFRKKWTNLPLPTQLSERFSVAVKKCPLSKEQIRVKTTKSHITYPSSGITRNNLADANKSLRGIDQMVTFIFSIILGGNTKLCFWRICVRELLLYSFVIQSCYKSVAKVKCFNRICAVELPLCYFVIQTCCRNSVWHRSGPATTNV